MKVLETRRKDGMKWRRYRTADGRTVTTYEVPAPVLRGIVPASRLRARLAQWENGEKLRTRHTLMCKRIAEGVKPEAIAYELGLTARSVQRAKQKIREKNELRKQAARAAKLRQAESEPAATV